MPNPLLPILRRPLRRTLWLRPRHAGSALSVLNGKPGTFVFTGGAAGFQVILKSSAGTFTESGKPASLLLKHLLKASSPGAFAETGHAAGFVITISGLHGTFTFTGGSVGLDGVLFAGKGVFVLSGGASFFVPNTADMRLFLQNPTKAVSTPSIGGAASSSPVIVPARSSPSIGGPAQSSPSVGGAAQDSFSAGGAAKG